MLAEAGGASAAEAMGSFAAPWDAAARRRGRGEALGGGATTTCRVGTLGGGAQHTLNCLLFYLKVLSGRFKRCRWENRKKS